MPSRKPLEHSKDEAAVSRQATVVSIFTAAQTSMNRHLLPEAKSFRMVFGRTTRLQVLILLIITAYATVVSFAGLVYMQLYTDVKNMPGVYRNRTTLGPWSNRIGVIAYALTPFSVFLSNRESLLSLLTGIPYQNFNFLHRWLGFIIFAQSTLHTIAWLIVELNLYQPQPQVWKAFISETYAIWGFVAMVAILILFILSLPFAIRLTGYEVFRKLHYILAMVFIGGLLWTLATTQTLPHRRTRCLVRRPFRSSSEDICTALPASSQIHIHVIPERAGKFDAPVRRAEWRRRPFGFHTQPYGLEAGTAFLPLLPREQYLAVSPVHARKSADNHWNRHAATYVRLPSEEWADEEDRGACSCQSVAKRAFNDVCHSAGSLRRLSRGR